LPVIEKCPLLEKTRILPNVDQVHSQEFVMGEGAVAEVWGQSPQRSAIFTIFQ